MKDNLEMDFVSFKKWQQLILQMSILEYGKLSLHQNPENQPQCPSAPKLKPFSSSSTLDEEDDLFKLHQFEYVQRKYGSLDELRDKREKKHKRPMLEFLREKIQRRNIERHL